MREREREEAARAAVAEQKKKSLAIHEVEEEEKEEEQQEDQANEFIKLKVRYDTKNTDTFKVKPSDHFQVLMNKILRRRNKTKVIIRLDGEGVRPSDTAEDLDLEDGDMLDVIVA